MINYFFNKNITTKKGFTILEVLVVVTIISVLSSMTVTYVLDYITKAKIARTKAEFIQFVKIAYYAEAVSGKRLQDITGSAWTSSACQVGDLRNVPDTHPCYVAWIHALGAIAAAAGPEASAVNNMQRDPWGSPYLLDENEREHGPNDCTQDRIFSAGPDGLFGGADQIEYKMYPSKPCP